MARAAQQDYARMQGERTVADHPDPLRTFLWNAIMDRATDVHLHCVENGIRILHRVDGAIHPKLLLPPAEGKRLLNQLKTASGLNAMRSFGPLEGRLDWADGDASWEIRVTLTPVRNKESAHLRFLSVPNGQWDISNLGFSPADQEKTGTAIQSLNGLVLVTGPTGSGKTTTMYSLASLMDMRTTTAYSIEDPVEFRLPYAQQIEVDEQHGLSMHEGLRTILRMDPDLILIGEIRDRDSAIVAARAALSGRLVLATIHAHDTVGAVDALHYLGVPYHIIGSSLRLIIAQNLLRQLCGECAQPRELDEAERDLFSRFGQEAPQTLLHPGSCGQCNWYGYKGRTGIFEVATIDDEVAGLISAGTRNGELRECLCNKGMRSMAQDGLEKATRGVTSMEELFRVCGFTPAASLQQEENAPEVEMVAG